MVSLVAHLEVESPDKRLVLGGFAVAAESDSGLECGADTRVRVIHDVGDRRGALEEVEGERLQEVVGSWDLGLGCEVICAADGEGGQAQLFGAEWRDRGVWPPCLSLSTHSRCSAGISAAEASIGADKEPLMLFALHLFGPLLPKSSTLKMS
ncbi:hypothetical protein GOP47_0029711 [Adiantum capillus-veneris]|nr:hypothetical protein GOP47_0029711 [Adiantum capillus-veneris]